jgi:hypothetical protein
MKLEAQLVRRVALGAVVGTGVALAAPAAAQDPRDAPVPPRATAYAEVASLPDWNGVWYPDWSLLFSGRAAARPVLTPRGQEIMNAYTASIRANGPNQEAQAQCLPPGIPGLMQQPYPIEVLFSPGRVTILTEAYQQARRIYTDGRPLPEDFDLFYTGNSVGYWDGDMLVIDTVGLSPRTNIVPGLPHTEASRVHEHVWLQAPGQLFIEFTITNPELLAQPLVTRVAYKLDNEFPMREYVCSENNRLRSGEDGANIDLGFEHLDEPDPFGPAPE